MIESIYNTPEDLLEEFSDKLLSALYRSSLNAKDYRSGVFNQITPKVFRNERYILYKVLYSFRDRNIVPDEEFLRLHLTLNEDYIYKSARFINVADYADLDENPSTAYTIAVLKKYKMLFDLPELEPDDFWLLFEKFKSLYQHVHLENAFKRSVTILNEGVQEGKKMLQGSDAAISYVKKAIADVDVVMDAQSGSGYVDFVDVETYDEKKPEKIGDFGDLKTLNDHFGGIFTPNFYSIVAPTKGGKSKFTTRMVHNIAVENGNPVVVWAHEGGFKAWVAQLRAIHFDYYYNSKEPDPNKWYRGVSQDVILYDKFPTDAIRQLEQISYIDLRSKLGTEYGRIMFVDRPFKVETFIDEVDAAVRSIDAKAVLVDYMQLIGWDSSNLSKFTAIGQAYQKALAYCKAKNVAWISPAQMTQEFMKELAKSKDGTAHETRTAGGESSEVIRTPDINIALYGTVDDIRAGSMKILSIPSRMAEPFPTFDIFCDLGVCKFIDLKFLD